ncbi:MAG: sialate O-acetylesterase [Planctomycetaceae bacterium]
MIRAAIILILAVLAGTQPSSAAEKPVHLFILSGQSNMAGMNPKTGFEPEARQLFPDADIVYLKVSRGGQPIRLWVREYADIANRHKLTVPGKATGTPFYEPILKQYRALLVQHPRPASVTFCWMQGERDAREKLSAAYQEALEHLIKRLRTDLEQPGMNVIIGRLSDFGGPESTDWQNIRQAQVAVAAQDTRGAWVDCDDLNDKESKGTRRNDLHYTTAGYELLGRRFARQAQALISGSEPHAKGRPD